MLSLLEGTPAGIVLQEQVERLAALPRLESAEIAAALTAHLRLLDRVRDGIALTDAGYLPPPVVKELAPLLPTMRDWIFPVRREVDALPVLWFRQHVIRAGLLRSGRGSLLLTAAGRRGLADPAELWDHLAQRLIPTRRAFDAAATILLIVQAAASPGRRPDLPGIAETLGRLGWAHSGGGPVRYDDVQWVWNDVWAAIGNVGERVGTRWDSRIPSRQAVALARDALLVAVAPDR